MATNGNAAAHSLVIYRIENTETGEVYIGQTRQGAGRRWDQHRSDARRGVDSPMCHAMRQHGMGAFTFEVVCHALTSDDLDALETALIAQHDSYANGYNRTPTGSTLDAVSLAKISAAHKGRKAPWIAQGWVSRKLNGNGSTRGRIPTGANNNLAKSYLVQTPTGRLLAITGLKAFCREQGLTFKAMYDTLNGVQRRHKGFALLRSYSDRGNPAKVGIHLQIV
jgi:hypothetical protein